MNQVVLTLENYRSVTGKRFRVTPEQKVRIKAGTLTREEAFQEFLFLRKGEGSSS